jgi:uncharacterized OB-fold protein
MITRPRPVETPDDSAFWAHVGAGELRMQRCVACARLRYPPAPCCPTCLCESAEWAQVSGFGTLLSWVTMRRQYFPTLPVPYVVGAVELEEGPIMYGNLDLRHAGRLRAGLPVEAVLENCRLEDGTPFVVPQWRPREVTA